MGNPSADEGNFGFGFNEIDFSDRVLRLEITPLECGTDFKVKEFNINSLILAAKSPFFYKLFKNGMREWNANVSLRIDTSEEEALMDLLNFMYGNPLKATSFRELLDVLMVADKFKVTSCRKHCIDLLHKLPMSTESAIFYLELPSNVFDVDEVEPLINTAKRYLAAHFSTWSQEEAAMALSLTALEVVLGSDGLKVNSEDDVFDFVINWARVNYPKLEERREVLTKRLMHLICLPSLSSYKLKRFLYSSGFGFPRRAYNYRHIDVLKLESDPPRCLVYFELKKQECIDLFSSFDQINTQAFCLGRRQFSLYVKCVEEPQNGSCKFGVFVDIQGPPYCALDFVVAVMKNTSNRFHDFHVTNYCKLKPQGVLLFHQKEVTSEENMYFIDGILHLRAQITINN